MRSVNRLRSRGQILVIVALAGIVLIGFAALAVDSALTYGVKAKLNAAVDAAAVAAARATVTGASDAARQAAAISAGQRFFNMNFPDGYLGASRPTPSIQATHEADGRWSVSVSADAARPTSLMGVFGVSNMTIHGEAASVRRDVDMILVIDTSGSLGAAFPQVKSAAVSFVSKFASGPGGDRVGLVAFASGAVLSVPIDKTATRGFTMSTMTSTINALGDHGSASGSTASAEGLRIAHDEIDRIDPSLRSSLRVIVFFSDGAPNDVPATFQRASTTLSGDLYSDTSGRGTGANSQATNMYYSNQRDSQIGTYTDIASLPANGFSTTAWQQAPIPIPLTSYNNARAFISWPANNRCNVNIAARNMSENVANTIRGEGIFVYTLGLGAELNQLEPQFTGNNNNCGYAAGNGTTEFGARILQRLANTPDPGDPKVAQDTAQPVGMYAYAADASQLDSAFNAIASEILRLTR